MQLIDFIEIGTVFFAAFGGSAFGAYLEHRYNRKSNNIDLKRDVLRRLVANRHRLTNPDPLTPINETEEPFIALNEAYAVYSDDKQVIADLQKFHSGFTRDNLTILIKSMAKSVEIAWADFNNDFTAKQFTPSETGRLKDS